MFHYPIIDTGHIGRSLEIHIINPYKQSDELETIYLSLFYFYDEISTCRDYHDNIIIDLTYLENFHCCDFEKEAELINKIMRLIFSYDDIVQIRTFHFIFDSKKAWQKEIAEYYKQELPKLFKNNYVEVILK